MTLLTNSFENYFSLKTEESDISLQITTKKDSAKIIKT